MSWSIDPLHSHVGFSVKHMMVTTVRGQFKTYSGTLNLDPKDFTKSTFSGDIDVANHPKITFKSTRIEAKSESEYVVHGDITIRGVTKPIALDVEFGGARKNPWGKTVVGIGATGTLNRKDFGVNFNAVLEAGGVMVGEKVKLEVEVEAVLTE